MVNSSKKPKHCPNPQCNLILFKDYEFKGSGVFHMKCPHCQEFVEVIIKPEISVSVKILGAVIILLLIVFPLYTLYKQFKDHQSAITEQNQLYDNK